MRLELFLSPVLAVLAIADAASACEPVMDERTPSQIRFQSKRVAVDGQCRTINAGVYDRISLGPAIDLGNGLIQQVLGEQFTGESDQSRVFIADCNIREVTILRGKVTSTAETSCGPIDTYADLVGPNAMMKFEGSASYKDLVDLALSKGVTEISPSEFFFKFSKDWETELYPVGRKDQFDLLCGCKIYYPDSLGAKN